MRLFVAFLAGLLYSGFVLGHGESKPGPHGGEIRMPSGFHVEAVAGDRELTVYVLDMQFENPTTENASVSARLKQDGTAAALQCRARESAFKCPLPAGVDLDQGTLVIAASRGELPTAKARYDLPLLQADGR